MGKFFPGFCKRRQQVQFIEEGFTILMFVIHISSQFKVTAMKSI